jgi:outer membrane protein OmpA-like peptidoglycan-associated protein
MEKTVAPLLLVASVSLGLAGCATEDWVKTYVKGQNAPIEARLQQVDSRVTQVASDTAEARKTADEGVRRADSVNNRITQAIAAQQKLTPVDSIVLRYKTDQFKLQPRQTKALDGVKETLANNPTYTVHIVGEADKPGAESHNDVLSLQRAAQVQRYLASNNGKGETLHRISAIGAGEELATSRGPDPEHRQVTVAIFKPSME